MNRVTKRTWLMSLFIAILLGGSNIPVYFHIFRSDSIAFKIFN